MYDYTDIQCRLLDGVDKNRKNQKLKRKQRSNEQIKKPKYIRHVCQPYFRQSKNFLKLQDEYDRIEHEIMEFFYNDAWEWYLEQQELERKKREEDDDNQYN